VKRASERADAAYQTLHRAIIEQALEPGTKLREDQLGAHFGISRTLVRIALARLVGEGLVERRHRRSAMVARPTLKEARDAFGMRIVLEREVIRLVIAGWRPECGAELEGRIREEEVAARGNDPHVSIRLAGEFHAALARLTDNTLLERHLGEVVSRCSVILALYGRPHSSECAVNEHHEILVALRRRDEAAASLLMERHLSSVAERARLSDEPAAEPQLEAILSRYSAPIMAGSSAVEFRKVQSRKGR
jgi:DNA-binding GntR family transcriptional regulator